VKDLSIVGAGSWGTALSIVLGPRFDRVRMWSHNSALADEVGFSRENVTYLPGFRLPEHVELTDDLERAVCDTDVVLLVVPAQCLRNVFQRSVPFLEERMMFVSATKGIETGSLARMSEIVQQETPFSARVATLSGPTFAREIAKGDPAAVVIASPDGELASTIQAAFSGPTLRLYTNSDQTGVELAGALKNIIAIGAGIVHGLGLGSNTVAALVTRGLAEITRLAVAAGGRASTLAGLAGLGDLVLTCGGDLSRNRRVGIELGKGRSLAGILRSTQMVAEGVETTYAAVDLARKLGVEMPITVQMNAVLREGKPPEDGIRDLMDRALRSE
jgi:glycerol-3-phosphate dehydrogenase (NAD(P)+)